MQSIPVAHFCSEYQFIRSAMQAGYKLRRMAGKSGGGKSRLSMAFKRIMEQAQVEAGVARLSSGAKGRSFSLRSFHSLRHSFISALANSGLHLEPNAAARWLEVCQAGQNKRP
jgi:integrase